MSLSRFLENCSHLGIDDFLHLQLEDQYGEETREAGRKLQDLRLEAVDAMIKAVNDWTTDEIGDCGVYHGYCSLNRCIESALRQKAINSNDYSRDISKERELCEEKLESILEGRGYWADWDIKDVMNCSVHELFGFLGDDIEDV